MIDIRQRITNGQTGRYPLDPNQVIGIAVHHSVSGGQFYTAAVMTPDDEIAHLLMIDAYHVWKGWGGFAYYLAAFPSGRWYYCGDLAGARAHVASRNHQLIGVVLIGDFTSSPPPAAALAAARQAIDFVQQRYPGRAVDGHRQWALPQFPTACPGDTWASWLPSLAQPQPQQEDAMSVIIQVGPHQYLVSKELGVRVFLGPAEIPPYAALNPQGFRTMGVPVLQLGDPGAPATVQELWGIPSLEEIVARYARQTP